MFLKHKTKLLLLLTLHIIGVVSQTCTTENPCPNPAIKKIGIQDWMKVAVSSNCTGTYTTPEGTAGILCPPFNGSLVVDKQTVSLVGNTFEVEVLDTFWLSAPSFVSANNYKEQFLEYDFKDRFLIRSIDLIFRSPSNNPQDMRPTAMKFQGKNEAGVWVDWSFYAADCAASYNKQPSDLLFNKEPVCSTRLSANPPSNNGGPLKVGFRPIETFKQDFYDKPHIYTFFITSAIRVVFNRPPITDDPATSYYVVADLDIHYQCACFGHGSSCGGENGGECSCVHNTGGSNCQQCLPLFNNQPWSMSVNNVSYVCEECNCNNRSLSCSYDSLQQTGTCTQCLHNTTGPNCESCQQNFFLNPQAGVATGSCTGTTSIGLINYNCGDVCIPCNCSQAGSRFLGSPCNTTTGQCACKDNVQGRTCNVCKDGYFKLDLANPAGCSRCDCDERGMITCDKLTGACQCKVHTIEPNCIGCEIGYYNFTGENPDGCTFCDCDVGRSNQQNCDPISGNCNCRAGTTGRDCRDLAPNFFAPNLDHLTLEAEYAVNVSGSNLVERPGGGEAGSGFTGRGFHKVTQPLPPFTQPSIVFSLVVPASNKYQLIVRYESAVEFPGVVSSINTAMNIATAGVLNNPCINTTLPQASTTSLLVASSAGFSAMTPEVCLVKDIQYFLTLTFQGNIDPTKTILIDSVVVLPVINTLPAYLKSDDSVKVQMKTCLTASQKALSYPSNCSVIGNSIMVDLTKAAYPCQCDLVGSVDNRCQAVGGQCSCKPNVFFRNCSQCILYSYGFESNTGCTACNCHVNGSNSLFCSSTGACECKANVTGTKCDSCIDKHYGLFTGQGCKPCDCGGIYVLNDSCIDSGQCFCKPGVGGLGCDACAVGFFGLTDEGCSSCGCDVDGSIDASCHHMAGGCQCRSGVQGPQCNKCKPGFYGLGPYTSDGCLKCFCSGHSSDCTSAPKWYRAVSESHWDILEGDVFGARWTGLDGNGVKSTLQKQLYLNFERQVLMMVNTAADTTASYFVSPAACTTSVVTTPNTRATTSCFIGYKAPSYGQYLTFTIATNTSAVLPPLPPETPAPLPQPPAVPLINFAYPDGDVVINGVNSNFKLVTNLTTTPTATPTEYKFRLDERSWFKDSVAQAVRPTYAEMMQVLYNVESIYIRSKFSNVVGSVGYLFKVQMDYVVDKLTGKDTPATNVEMCVCPEPYEGQYCQKCKFGFTKSKTVVGECVPCECNKHEFPGTACDPETGVCQCRHHTTGAQCETCMDSYYGDATQGQPDSCKACLCPGDITNPSSSVPIHSSAKKCNNTGAASYTCLCDEGYIGSMCERCAPGFFGQPSNPEFNGGVCRKCDCNNYNDDQCDDTNGTCLACGGNTAGSTCDRCLSNFYAFDFLFTKKCEACDCTGTAALGCNNKTSDCNCQQGVDMATGCKECSAGFYNYTSAGCTPCNCFLLGTLSASPNCSNMGVCTCSENFTGDKCDRCKNNTYGSNCQVDCGCLTAYTVNGDASCNITTGQCNCLRGFTGNTCDACSPFAGNSYTGIKEVVDTKSTFPNCTSCSQCYDDIASKSSAINNNITDFNNKLILLRTQYYASTNPLTLENNLVSIKASYMATNQSLLQLQDLMKLRNNVSYFDVDTRIPALESQLQAIESSKEALQVAMVPLREINSENLRTDNPQLPVVSLTNVRNTLAGLINTQNTIATDAAAAYQGLTSHDMLVKNLPAAIAALSARVAATNSSIAGTEPFLQTSSKELDGIETSKFNNDILKLDFQQKTAASKVAVLSDDMTTARYYTSVSAVMYKNGSQQLLQISNIYSTLNSQFSLTSNIATLTQQAKTLADDSARSVKDFCNTANSQMASVVFLMTNLSRAKSQLEAPLLSQYDTTTQQISNTNIDLQSNQVASLARSIRANTVPRPAVANIGQLADNSASTASTLTSNIRTAVNKTQEARNGLEGLQETLRTTSKEQTEAKECHDLVTNQDTYIRNTIVFITGKANRTAVAATTTADHLLNNTNSTQPIKDAFNSVASNFSNSLNSLQLTNTSADQLQKEILNNTAGVPALSLSVTNKRVEYDRWELTKNQLEACVNDLWTSFNALNQPVSINALLDFTNRQTQEIQQLNTDIENLEKELEALQESLETVSQDGVSCKDVLPS